MPLMKHSKTILTLILFVSGTCISCNSKLPATPGDSFKAVKSAYEKKDAKRLMSLFTKGTAKAYEATAETISQMDEGQREALYTRGVIPGNGKLSGEDILQHELNKTHSENDNPIYLALSKPVISTGEKSGKANIRTSDGVELHFIKEGSYWKFSPEGR